MKQCLALLFTRDQNPALSPLTDDRITAAMPYAGKYRVVDFALSNCLHSGIRNILVLTNQKYYSLQKHLRDGWSIFNPELGEYITVVPPRLAVSPELVKSDYDLVQQQLYLLERNSAQYVIMLNGSHIYRMDYAAMLQAHMDTGVDMTLACTDSYLTAQNNYFVSIDGSERITGLSTNASRHKFVSMGILICDRLFLIEKLKQLNENLGSFPNLADGIVSVSLENASIQAYPFGGSAGRVTQDHYWATLDSLDTYYQANMDLLNSRPSIDIYQSNWQIRTYQSQTPPARTIPGEHGTEGIFINSICAGGTVIEGGSVQHSILYPNVYVGDDAFVEQSIVFEQVKIGSGARIKGCIIEKGNIIPRNEEIGHDLKRDRERFQVTEKGLVVVPSNYY
jgi:glucose-1-phosphate adenylyltransferase